MEAIKLCRLDTPIIFIEADRKSGSAGMPRPISYAVFCLKKKNKEIEILFVHLNPSLSIFFFFFNDTATTEIYTLSLHDALPIYLIRKQAVVIPALSR